jgi:uncharacterized membrane protein YqhA
MLQRLEKLFESLLWNSRLVVLVAVVASLVVAMVMFFIATLDVWVLVTHLGGYAALTGEARLEFRTETIASVVEVVDGYLVATIMLIFSLGLYELFVSRIEVAEGSEFAQRVLLIRSLDDLKDRLAKLVLLILVVKFFEHALTLKYGGPLELLYLAAGVLLVSLALHFSQGKSKA